MMSAPMVLDGFDNVSTPSQISTAPLYITKPYSTQSRSRIIVFNGLLSVGTWV